MGLDVILFLESRTGARWRVHSRLSLPRDGLLFDLLTGQWSNRDLVPLRGLPSDAAEETLDACTVRVHDEEPKEPPGLAMDEAADWISRNVTRAKANAWYAPGSVELTEFSDRIRHPAYSGFSWLTLAELEKLDRALSSFLGQETAREALAKIIGSMREIEADRSAKSRAVFWFG